ncbi:MAG TPA: LLM class flavin-dependent oxidoreductase [Candidatus Limnocylindrales bacterium]|nr:LLM class flavin-dependent oxidoreductase [Candidatus Limnocylindrales bacterium]
MPTSPDAVGPVIARLGTLGVWSSMEARPVAEQIAYAQRAEVLGFGAVWANEISGREPFALVGALATRTERVGLALGVASIYARDAAAARAGARTLAELSGDRFVMGLGVSHPERVEDERGHVYQRPLPAMRSYLEAWEGAPYTAHRPRQEPPLILAALRGGMLGLAGARTEGAFPYLVPVSYVAGARARLDAAAADAGRPGRPALIVNLPAIPDEDPATARAGARTYLAGYLRRPAYRDNLLEQGFRETDFAATGSDRLVDELVAWGAPEAIAARASALREAGADHLVVMPISSSGTVSDPAALESLARTLIQ